MVGECGGVSDAQVYRKDLFLAVQQQLQTAGEYEERRLLKRRVDSTVNLCLQQRCVSKFEDPTRIILALKTLWTCFCFCQLDVWLWTFLPTTSFLQAIWHTLTSWSLAFEDRVPFYHPAATVVLGR